MELNQTFAGAIVKITRLAIDGVCVRNIRSCSGASCLPDHVNRVSVPPLTEKKGFLTIWFREWIRVSLFWMNNNSSIHGGSKP